MISFEHLFNKKSLKNLGFQICILVLIPYCLWAQGGNFKKKFVEANYHVEYNNYALALPIYKRLLAKDENNANLNYKVGLCYIHSYNEKTLSIPYLEKAVDKMTTNYDIFSHTLKKAPPVSRYYLGLAYHLNYEFKKAIETFKTFEGEINEKHIKRKWFLNNKRIF